MTSVAGLLLAAGAGRRFGGPKALARDDDGTSWLLRSVQALRPCAEVVVVLGAGAEQAAALLPMSVARVRADDWADGMGASLRAGLEALEGTDHDAALVTLVDLPDVGGDVVGRLLGAARGSDVLARAAYDGVPGHPVLIGRDHWAGVVTSAAGDRGARDYLAARAVDLVECGDLATGVDVDAR
ncbi:nucleotidyltransferase family protein [Nocardioides okcheonensis]|uniref:nucleotidyltransferase family protein n=1 Tax=Nocardioides okcheonensis TaxID=2894081 RepID=UPI001E456E74|nr:NTP transferase domain-containing protein [Nocardioides okcheonensis]UFN43730.1 NTP transferase domain-containing protein [Nocardioides okcheonensis]